ncbi:MAG TPA: peptidoglycan-binding protein [Devosia sp.]|nr:peptidoglycan-binding protein [Devosia sp.]
MARAFPSSPVDIGEAPQTDDWQALKGELVALLDQVEGQYASRAGHDPAFAGFAQRMRDLRYKVADAPAEDRRREALRSVKRQVDRFNERGEPESAPAESALQTAIQEIRLRTRPEPARAAAPIARMAPPHEASADGDIDDRLRRLEGELASRTSGRAEMREISGHLAQLTQMVEALAGAVGDDSQTRRLETQIAGLVQLVSRGPQADVAQLGERIDQVAATLDRLADLQVQQIHHAVLEAESGPGKEAEQARGLQAVEESLRNIYDRMDALEHSLALPGAEFERIGAMLAEIGGRIGEPAASPAQQDRLVGLIDALNGRVAAMEGRHAGIDLLKADIDDLRDTVLETVEPRFQDIQQRLGDIKDRLAIRAADPPGVAQLEAQIRQLVARMDQSAEQLARIADVRSQAAPALPDFERLADMVADRTSSALARQPGPRLSADSLAEMEARIGRLVEGFLHSRPAADHEKAAMPRGAGLSAPSAAEPPGAALERAAAAREQQARSRSSAIADAMPRNPAAEAPLTDPGFPDPGSSDAGPVRSALEARGSSPKPVEAAMPADGISRPSAGRPAFDPAAVTPPPRPRSSFDSMPEKPFEPAPASDDTVGRVPPSSKNTFIEAARRAAQRQQASIAAAPAAESAIGRAFARFSGGKAAPDPAPADMEPEAPARRSWFARREAGAEAPVPPEAETAPQVEAEPRGEPQESFLLRHRRPILIAASLVAVSFMALNLVLQRMAESGHPAAPPVAAAKPAAPAPQPASPAPAASTPAPAAALKPASLVLPLAPRPAAEIAAPIVPPKPTDATTTASIDPGAPLGYAAADNAAMPPALAPVNSAAADAGKLAPAATPAAGSTAIASTGPALPPASAPAPAPLESPVKVEPPPAALGPAALRQAAANGDARAQFEVAAIYSEGHAVPQNMAQAAAWYERAAAQGFVPAQYRLGNLYELGQGVTKDLEQARLWYQRAAEAGNRMAMHNLAALYAGGQFGKQDFTQAASWFEQAAQRGMKDSQFNLGMLYARGLGVPQSLPDSYKWFALAAATGDTEAAKSRDNIARSLDAEALKKAQADVAAWKPTPIDLAANFAPIGTWEKNFNPGPAITDKDVVSKVQQALARLGYDVGTPNGKIGTKTSQAIKAFERGTGMSEVGAINPRLLAVLGSQPV